MEQYNVTGMSCAACQVRVEKAVNALPGVKNCAVSLLTNSMGVEGDASPSEIIKAVENAGYGASLKKSSSGANSSVGADAYGDELQDRETPKMKKRLIASVLFLIPLMYVSMGHMLWNWPLPAFLDGNHVAMGLYELLLSVIIMVINQKFFVSGFKGLIHKSPNMDSLVALGAGAAFVYSVTALFAMSSAVLAGDDEKIKYLMDQFYFESAATILTLITVGKMLEAKSKGKTTDALKSLMKMAPKTAVLVEGEGEARIEKTVPVDQVKKGDRFIVRPGDSIPVDGIVIEGESAVNEAALTGESLPVEKSAGSTVSAATINTSGFLICEAVRVGEDTTLSAIIRMVSDAAATKAPIAKIADRVSGIFVPAVILIALVTFIVWLLAGQSVGYAVARAVSVLVISCPCALGLATPVAIMVGNGMGAKSGILFKTAAAQEMAGKTQIVALDKTGTVTTGIMQVTDVIASEGVAESDLLEAAYALEVKSEHPISKAIVEYAEKKQIKLLETSGFEIKAGNGLSARLDGKTITGGNARYIESVVNEIPKGVRNDNSELHHAEFDSSSIQTEIKKLASQGKTPVLFARDRTLLGIIAVSDTIKEDSAQAISELKNMGIHTVLLTGDNEITARAIAEQAGVDEVVAGVLPDGKEAVIRKLMESGKVAMVGDGINDAPSLTRADLGIAIGAGTDIAIDAADVVLMKGSLRDVSAAIRLSRAVIKNIHENLFWAFFYNIIGIPLAAGCYVSAFGWTLNPMFGAAAMGLSSFCVVSNALRLNFLKTQDSRRDKKVKNPVTGNLILNNSKNKETEMKISVKGMMCGHCEMHVKKALEAIDGITEAAASHEKAEVTIETSKPVDESLIKAAVEEAGYEYAGVIA
ncbi:heavy metal translocating P-type ATPase [Treponema sp.]|uniref:heavy metal translocating P-type ATPase n=1 Tax=Treponema sp. TaxID=166 RepID=UPI00257C6C73|nr:heavy metal translocating P-type ATPase [Treponema sp.]MBE6353188.1 heavy metal translocating P-type ATPase [Treponema sp.]